MGDTTDEARPPTTIDDAVSFHPPPFPHIRLFLWGDRPMRCVVTTRTVEFVVVFDVRVVSTVVAFSIGMLSTHISVLGR